MSTPPFDTEVLIIGGGPTGSATAAYLRLAGHQVRIIEQQSFPRFHVGESLLPELAPFFDELGLTEKFSTIPQIKKTGAEFAFAWQTEGGAKFDFTLAQPWGMRETMNVERAPFDKVMLDHARDLGADVRENVTFQSIDNLTDGDVRIQTSAGTMRAKLLIDASGQNAVLGRQLGTRQIFSNHRKTAFMGHFTGVERLPQDIAGYPTIVMADDGWFWIIPIDDTRTSIGLVLDKDTTVAMRREGVKAGQELAWAIARTPLLAQRTREAVFPEKNGQVADFSFHCPPYADSGYLMVGDAAAFLDPVFSSGLFLALAGAKDAAKAASHILTNVQDGTTARAAYLKRVAERKDVFFHYINAYYDHAFREMLIEGRGPVGVHRAIIAFLTGKVQQMPFGMRWRLKLLNFCYRKHRKTGRLVTQREGWSILKNRRTSRTEAIASSHTLLQ